MPNLGERIRRATRSVRTRIVVSILVTAAFGLGVAGIVSYELQRTAVMQEIDSRLEGQLAEARKVVDAEDSFPTVGDALEHLMSVSVPPEDGGTLGLLDGEVAYTSGMSEEVQLEKIAGFATAAARTAEPGDPQLASFSADGKTYRYLAAPISIGAGGDTGVWVVGIDVGDRLAPLDATFRVYAAIAALSWVVIGLIGWLISGRLLSPLRRLNSTAARISTDALDERIPVTGRDELSAMTVTVNTMLDRIQTGVVQQRQLLDDVRHELKTPLAIVRGELELLEPADPDAVAEARRIGIEEIDRMVLLLDDLADLTEVRTGVPDFAPTDVTALTDDVLARASVLGEREWSVVQRATGDARLDRARIIQAWLQLAENADKYSAAGAPIELGSVGEGDAVRLFVRDHGDPIPDELRTRLFDRFVRGEDADRADGTGLGLAIVSAIAAGHGGRAEVTSSAEGNTFSVVLPRLPEAARRADEERRVAERMERERDAEREAEQAAEPAVGADRGTGTAGETVEPGAERAAEGERAATAGAGPVADADAAHPDATDATDAAADDHSGKVA